MKKLFIIFTLCLVFIFTLVSCGSQQSQTGTTPDNQGEQTSDAGEKLKIGFVYVGSANDGGFSQAHDEGRKYLEEVMGDEVETMFQETVSENATDVEAAMKNMIDSGAKVIVGNSFGYMDTMENLANEFPDVKFVHFSGNKKNDTNFDNFFGAMEEPRYLSGIVAGMKTKTNKLGFVGAFPQTELFIAVNAFTLGAQSVNPEASVNVVWINSWYDPAKEKDAAEALIEGGCDVIAQHVDTKGPTMAAQENGVFSIGYNTDAIDAGPDAFITAPVWNHGAYYVNLAKNVIDGTFKPTSYYGNMADNYVDLLPLSKNAPEGAKEKIDIIKEQIISGEFAPFTGPIKDQDGNIVVEDGKTLTREEIWQMDYLVEGVIGTTK